MNLFQRIWTKKKDYKASPTQKQQRSVMLEETGERILEGLTQVIGHLQNIKQMHLSEAVNVEMDVAWQKVCQLQELVKNALPLVAKETAKTGTKASNENISAQAPGRARTVTMLIQPSEITVTSLEAELISDAILNIENNMKDTRYSVSQLAKDIGMTRGHLYKRLTAITGLSPVEFIRIIRLKRGKSLLDQGKTNVSEVAYSTGFSAKQFAHYFKKAYGQTPTEYIKATRDKDTKENAMDRE